LTYSIETAIAEKFVAMIFLGDFNSRMKDFYDVYMLLENNEIDNEILKEAIRQTFKKRNSIFVTDHLLFSEDFVINSKRNFQWKHFLQKIKSADLAFYVVVKKILEKLHPIYNELYNAINQ